MLPLRRVGQAQDASVLGDFYDLNGRRYVLTHLDPSRFRQLAIEELSVYLIRYRAEQKAGRIMSQAALGKLLGYSQRQVSRLEAGEVVVGPDEELRIREILSGKSG